MIDLVNKSCEKIGNLIKYTQTKTKMNFKCHEYMQLQTI